MSGSLTIVGLGPGPVGLVTLEAADLLRAASTKEHVRVYGFSPVVEVVANLAPDLEVTLLDDMLGTDERATAYQRLIGQMMKDAFRDGLDVLYLVSGNPLMVNDLVLFLRRACRRYDKPVRLVQGLSFVELMLDRVYWQADRGLQLLSAWSIAEGGAEPDPRVPALVYEIGETSAETSMELLIALSARLGAIYPPEHTLILVYGTGPPTFESRSRILQVRDLCEMTLTPLSNLWIPSLSGPALERDIAP